MTLRILTISKEQMVFFDPLWKVPHKVNFVISHLLFQDLNGQHHPISQWFPHNFICLYG